MFVFIRTHWFYSEHWTISIMRMILDRGIIVLVKVNIYVLQVKSLPEVIKDRWHENTNHITCSLEIYMHFYGGGLNLSKVINMLGFAWKKKYYLHSKMLVSKWVVTALSYKCEFSVVICIVLNTHNTHMVCHIFYIFAQLRHLPKTPQALYFHPHIWQLIATGRNCRLYCSLRPK